MDVDKKKSTTVRTQNLPKLTPQIRDELRKEGACFRCRKPGHMSRECPGPDLTPVSTSSSKTTSGKGKNRREVVEEDDEEKADESEEEAQPKKQEKKKVRKAKATPSVASSSRTPIIETDDEEEPPSYQSARASIMRTLAQSLQPNVLKSPTPLPMMRVFKRFALSYVVANLSLLPW